MNQKAGWHDASFGRSRGERDRDGTLGKGGTGFPHFHHNEKIDARKERKYSGNRTLAYLLSQRIFTERLPGTRPWLRAGEPKVGTAQPHLEELTVRQVTKTLDHSRMWCGYSRHTSKG